MNNNRIWAVKLFFWLLLLLLFLVLIVLPSLTTVLSATGNLPRGYSKYLEAIEKTQFIAISIFTIVWIFFLGSCFASFLNVVAWRVPRGRSILGSSHCPYCNVTLTFKNNIPVVGWIKNGGRCAKCKLPISPRYLVAEIILGSLFLFLALIQLSTGGANLPFRPVDPFVGFEHLLFAPKWDLIRLVFFHLVLISTLFTFALIEFDRLRIPRPIFLFSFLLACGLAIVWPSTLLMDWRTLYIDPGNSDMHWVAVVTILVGTVSGYLVGLVLHWVITRNANGKDVLQSDAHPQSEPNEVALDQGNGIPILGQTNSDDSTERQLSKSSHALLAENHILIGLTLTGAFLGWQSVLSIVIIFLTVAIVSKLAFQAVRPQLSDCFGCCAIENATLLFAVVIHLVSWRLQSAIPFWLDSQPNWATLVMGLALSLILLLVHQYLFKLNRNRIGEADEDDALSDRPHSEASFNSNGGESGSSYQPSNAGD